MQHVWQSCVRAVEKSWCMEATKAADACFAQKLTTVAGRFLTPWHPCRLMQAAGAAPGRPGLTPVRPDSPPDSPGSDMAGMSPY